MRTASSQINKSSFLATVFVTAVTSLVTSCGGGCEPYVPQTASIKIFDAVSGLPAACGAKVTLGSWTEEYGVLTCTQDNMIIRPHIGAGTFDLTVTKEGYETWTGSVEARATNACATMTEIPEVDVFLNRAEDWPPYSCPPRQDPETCENSAGIAVTQEDILGHIRTKALYQNPDGLYLTETYTFNADGTYEVLAEPLQRLTENCQGFSDGGGPLEEFGTYSITANAVMLQPTEFNYSMGQPSYDAHELRVHSINPEDDSLVVSGKDFCSLTMTHSNHR